MRVLLCVLLVVGVVAPLRERAPGGGERKADVEFSFAPGRKPADKAAVALALWRTGAVQEVRAPRRSSRLHGVYVRDPGNLLQIQQVHELLASRDEVTFDASVPGWILKRKE